MAWMSLQQRKAKLDRVSSRLMSQRVDHHLDSLRRVRVADRPPPQRCDGLGHVMPIDCEIGDLVRHVSRTLHRQRIDSIFYQHRLERTANYE